MASNFDAFASLNKYLNQADEDSFKYGSSSTEESPNSSVAGENLKPVSALIDLSGLPEVVPKGKGRKSLRGKPADESFDLTDGSFDVLPPKRSRRAADELGTVVDIVELDTPSQTSQNNTIQESTSSASSTSQPKKGRGRPKKDASLNNSSHNTSQESTSSTPSTSQPKKGKGRPKKDASLNNSSHNTSQESTTSSSSPTSTAKKGRGGKKKSAAPKVAKPKRMTLKQSLALISKPIPTPKEVAMPKAAPTARPPPKARDVARPSRSSAVDLTGDVHLDSMHSSAPLFQKQTAKKQPEEPVPDLDLSQEEEDTVRIKIKMKDGIKAFTFRRYQRFLDLYKQISEKEGIPVSSLFFYDGDKRIHADDTPHSVNYKISTIYTCHIMSGVKQTLNQPTSKDSLVIKFQSDKWKQPIVLKVSKLDTFTAIVGTLCEQMKLRPNQVSLRFDGDKIDLSESPMDLDFEGGEIVDCKVNN